MRYPRYMFQGLSASDALLSIKLVTSGDSALQARTVHCLALATFNSGAIRTALVAAKIRINPVNKTKKKDVAPGDRVTMPRLELSVLDECVEFGRKIW